MLLACCLSPPPVYAPTLACVLKQYVCVCLLPPDLQRWHRQDCGRGPGALRGRSRCQAMPCACMRCAGKQAVCRCQQMRRLPHILCTFVSHSHACRLSPAHSHDPSPPLHQPQAKIIAQEYSAVTGAVGTLAWSSPEMLLGARCTERSDIYSYGERSRGCCMRPDALLQVCVQSCSASIV